jgi:hypothetical protein
MLDSLVIETASEVIAGQNFSDDTVGIATPCIYAGQDVIFSCQSSIIKLSQLKNEGRNGRTYFREGTHAYRLRSSLGNLMIDDT